MKLLSYSFLALILPLVVIIILLVIVMLPKIRKFRKEYREKILREGRPLSKEEKLDFKNKAVKELEDEMGTEDLKKAGKALRSELMNRDLKDLFKPEGK
jgi:F0F1-type ATP synthase membrane subunit b/b'